MKTVEQQPFGQLLLILLAVGLGGYSLWRLFRALSARARRQRQRSRPARGARERDRLRGHLRARGRVLLGSGASSGSPKKPTAGVFGWPAGPWIVGSSGVSCCGVGLYQVYRGRDARSS